MTSSFLWVYTESLLAPYCQQSQHISRHLRWHHLCFELLIKLLHPFERVWIQAPFSCNYEWMHQIHHYLEWSVTSIYQHQPPRSSCAAVSSRVVKISFNEAALHDVNSAFLNVKNVLSSLNAISQKCEHTLCQARPSKANSITLEFSILTTSPSYCWSCIHSTSLANWISRYTFFQPPKLP